MNATTPVVVTHSCSLFRDGLRQKLPKSHFRPIRLFPTVNDDVEHNLQFAEDGLWILGVDHFGADTETLVREVKNSNRTLKVVVLAAAQDEGEIIRALNAGVSGYLSEDISSDHLLKSLELILLGKTVMSPFGTMASTETSSQGEVNARTEAANATSHLPTNPGFGDNGPDGLPGRARRASARVRVMWPGASPAVSFRSSGL